MSGWHAGWFPETPAKDRWRWWDGYRWTGYRWPPDDEPAAAVPASGDYRVVYRPPNHGFHCFMTFLTCGMWAPVWMASAGGRYKIRKAGR